MALCTSQDVLVLLPSAGAQTDFAALIDHAGSLIAQYLGFPAYDGIAHSAESQTYTVYGNVPGGAWIPEDGTRIVLPVAPVTSITTLHEDGAEWAYGAASLIDSTDYVLDGAAGEIRFTPSGGQGAVDPTPRSVRIVFVAGWSGSAIPHAVRRAAVETVKAWWLSRRAVTQDDAGADGAPAPAPTWLPKAARQILAPYRRTTGWVA